MIDNVKRIPYLEQRETGYSNWAKLLFFFYTGRDSSIRPGWLTVGHELTNSNFNSELYASFFDESTTTGCTERIEALRPKSPPAITKSMRGRGIPTGRGGYPRGSSRGRGRPSQ